MTKEEMRAKAVDNAGIDVPEEFLTIIDDYDSGLIQGFEDGADWMQERMIEKAAEWLYIYYPTLERCKSFEDAWKHFEQAMKEGMQETNEGQALLYAVEKTAERTKREMMKKAVEWLSNNMFNSINNGVIINGYCVSDFIGRFKKAMQDESRRLD